jgi:hypothetical protein
MSKPNDYRRTLATTRMTKKAGDCKACSKPLPTPRPSRKHICDACLSDPVRLRAQRDEKTKRARERYAAERANRPAIAPVVRKCQHQQEHGGPLCGAEFEVPPITDKNGTPTSVHPNRQYCPQHSSRQAIRRRQWLKRNPEKHRKRYRRYYRRYSRREPVASRLREKKRQEAADLRAFARLGKKLKAAGEDHRKILRAMLTLYLTLFPKATIPEVGKIFNASDDTITRAKREAGILPKNRRAEKAVKPHLLFPKHQEPHVF